MADNEVRNLDWDSSISADASKEFERPPIGDYYFEVCGFEKAVSSKGNKMAVIEVKLLDGDQAGFKMKDNLVLTSNMEWKLAQFFECLGLKNKGEQLQKMPWDMVLGSQGRLKLKHEDYEGKTYCKVDKYLARNTDANTAPSSDMPFEI